MGKAPPRIYQYSISRSGSTVIWQILKYIFPDHTICKKHQPPQDTVKTVITYRDPRDRVASKWRKRNQNPDRQVTSRQQLQFLLDDNETQFNCLREYLESHSADNYLLLCYEHFYENFDYLFPRLETFFDITITQEQRQYIHDHFNVNSNKAVADSMPTFDAIDYNSGIHGNHICTRTKGAPGCWRRLIHPSLQKTYLSQLKKQMTYLSKLSLSQ